MTGWAINSPGHLDPAILEIFIDGDPAGTVVSDLYRVDLAKEGIRDGRAHFSFDLPDSVLDGVRHNLRFANIKTGEVLGGLKDFSVHLRRGLERFLDFQGTCGIRPAPAVHDLGRRLAKTKKRAILASYAAVPRLLAWQRETYLWLEENGFTPLHVHAASDGAYSDFNFPPEWLGIAKRNFGYDFGSWMVGLSHCYELLGGIEEVLLINDSCFLPLSAGPSIMTRAARTDADVVGLVDSYQHTYHLQSFFVLLKKAVDKRLFFDRFIRSYSFSAEKSVVIAEGELKLTKFLLGMNHSVKAVFDYGFLVEKWLNFSDRYARSLATNSAAFPKEYLQRQIDYLRQVTETVQAGGPTNPAHAFAHILLEEGADFLKREVLTINPLGSPFLPQISRFLKCSYPDRIAGIHESLIMVPGTSSSYI